MSTNTSKQNVLTRVQALIAGTQKHFPSGQFQLGGVTYTSASLVQAFQGLADKFAPVTAAHASVQNAVAALRAAEAQVAPLIRDYRSYLRTTIGDATQLEDFGLPARKARSPLSLEKRVVTAAKAKATRQARGTTSKKQKLAVKGNVTGVTVTPVTSPASPAPTATAAVPAPVATAPSGAPK